jgi:hypothetical protein
MSSMEFHPLGAFTAWSRSASTRKTGRIGHGLARTVANAAGPKKGGKAWRVEDFVPARKAEPKRSQSIDEVRRVVAAMVGKPNG